MDSLAHELAHKGLVALATSSCTRKLLLMIKMTIVSSIMESVLVDVAKSDLHPGVTSVPFFCGWVVYLTHVPLQWPDVSCWWCSFFLVATQDVVDCSA